MKTLIVNKEGKLSVQEIPKPKYNDNQALVKMIACGICNGTDSKLIHGTFKGIENGEYPLMLGHEGVGRVVEIGKNVKSFLELICDRGKICCYGIPANCNMNLDWSKAPYNWNLIFQQFPSKAEEGAVNEQIIQWIREGVVDLKEYISDYIPFGEVVEGFRKMADKKIKKKAIVVYEE